MAVGLELERRIAVQRERGDKCFGGKGKQEDQKTATAGHSYSMRGTHGFGGRIAEPPPAHILPRDGTVDTVTHECIIFYYAEKRLSQKCQQVEK